MGRLALGSALSALAIFLWGFLFWGAGIGAGAIDHGYNQEEVRKALSTYFPASGTYFVPDMMSGSTQEAFEQHHRQGPIAHVFIQHEGAEAMSAAVFVKGYLHMFVTSFLIGLLLIQVVSSLPTYGARAAFVTLAGAAAAVWTNGADPIWFSHPWKYHLYTLVYDVVAWGLAGLVLAKFVSSPARARL